MVAWEIPGPAGNKTFRRAQPTFGIKYLADEAFGRTSDEKPYVYLSDGGHFENLGLYEMVLRRCHTIVVIDADADAGYTFDNLGNAIRKIRIDLGIPIDFPSFPTWPSWPTAARPLTARSERFITTPKTAARRTAISFT